MTSDPMARPDTARLAARIVTRAEAMGLLELSGTRCIDAARVTAAVDALAGHGVARARLTADEVTAAVLAGLDAALEASPMPETEWAALIEVLGEDTIGQLVGLSASSVRRYRNATRRTPDDVAARLHFVALVVADLAGSYNTWGIRRWFARARPQLAGAAPREVLRDGWDPGDEPARAVAALAAAVVGPGNAT